MMKVGDILWSKPYYQPNTDKWQQQKIAGETRLSWLLENGTKINKKTMRETIPNFGWHLWYTDQGKLDHKWISENRNSIASKVSVCNDVSQLKNIALILMGKE
jgi:hypothetical protein